MPPATDLFRPRRSWGVSHTCRYWIHLHASHDPQLSPRFFDADTTHELVIGALALPSGLAGESHDERGRFEMHCSSGSSYRCSGHRLCDDVRSGFSSRLSRRAAPTRIANPPTTATRVHFGLMRTCQAPHGFLSQHIGPIEPGVFVVRNGSISLFTPHHHDRPSTHLRQHQSRVFSRLGAPC